MASRRQPVEIVGFIPDVLNRFVVEGINLPAGEDEVLNSIYSMWNHLMEIKKRVDAAVAIRKELAPRKKELDDELDELCLEIFRLIPKYENDLGTLPIRLAGLFTLYCPLRKVESQFKGISNKYGELLDILEKRSAIESGEGSSVTRSPQGNVDLIQQILKIIYRDEILKCCLLYLSIFPRGQLISQMRISRLWTAEGFCNLGSVRYYLQKLLDRKWIHPVKTRSDGGLSTFRVDVHVWEIIDFLSNDCNLARIPSSASHDWPERARYLYFHGTVENLDEEKFSQLHSLFIFNAASSKYKTTMSEASPSDTSENQSFPFNLKLLQVLDVTGAPPQIAPDAPPLAAPDALFKSTCLKYLRLRDTSIEVIPKSIQRLEHLEFLELKQNLITELPREAEGLRRLRHILIYHHEKDPLMESYSLIGFKALCRLGRFECLEKLCFMEADKETLGDLGMLTKLMRLGITELREEHGELLCSSLEKLERLESLNLHAINEDEIIDLHHLSPPPMSLKRLYLHCRLNKLPDWISSLDCLTKIVLRWSYLEAATQQEEDLLATLGKLPKLVELELRRAYNGRELDFKNGQFPKLKILLLEELGRLRSMSLAKGTMPSLEDLTISRCQWLERIPTGIEHLPTLQDLEFLDMSPEFYEMVPDAYRKSRGKPIVHLTQWRPGQWKTTPLVLDKCDDGFAGVH